MSEDLSALPAPAITARLYELRREERKVLVEILRYIGEVDRRRLYAGAGFPSLFAMLRGFLGYSDGAAFRRCTAARLLLRFPVLAEHLADGRLNLTTLVTLRDVLDEDNLDAVLARAAGRTEDEVKRLVAALRPRPPVPDLLRRVAEPPSPSANDAAVAPARALATPAVAPPAPAPPPRGRVEPLSATQHLLRATVSDEFVRDLEAVRAALGHKLPGASLEAVLHECLRVTLLVCEKRRRGSGKATPANDNHTAGTNGRYVPAAIRDAVWRRDAECCAFVAADGRRCGSTHRLELHHRVPFARGGEATLENLTLRCSVHNLHEARRDFGDAHIDAAIQRGRGASVRTSARQGSLF